MGVSLFGLAIYIKKYLKAKEELWKHQIFHHAKTYSSKKPSKRNQNPSRYHKLYD
jgi:molybdopterin synthase catalytic subunit